MFKADKHVRIRGEWFRAEKELLQFVEYAKLKYGEAAPHKPAPKRKAAPKISKVGPIIGRLHSLRTLHGPQTSVGHRLSSLETMIRNYRAATEPDRRKRLASSIRKTTDEVERMTST